MSSGRRIKPSREAQGALRALRRAQLNALELGLQTGTPVLVMRNGQRVDLTKDEKAVARLRAARAKEAKARRKTAS
jgi:hypothetical protein